MNKAEWEWNFENYPSALQMDKWQEKPQPRSYIAFPALSGCL
jgi:hypothetical protein